MRTVFASLGWALVLGIGSIMVGCAAPDAASSDAASSDAASSSEPARLGQGRLRLPLVTPTEDQFRLRNAIFQIDNRAGAPVASLDSELDPDATALTAELAQDSYTIDLGDGWSLERLADDGTSSPVRAALLTTNPASFQILNAEVTEVVYSFATNEGVVSFGEGAVSVSVNVATPPSEASCNVLDLASCPSGQSCLLGDGAGDTFCADSGSLPVGAPCVSDQCVAGAQCLRLEGSSSGESVCTRFCNPEFQFCGCRSLSRDPTVGICDPSVVQTGIIFSHTFEQNGFSPAACDKWTTFRDELSGGSFGRVSLSGSLGGTVECTDPGAASQICASLGNRGFTNVFCQGHVWNVGQCEDTELSVDSFICNCSFPGRTVRACDSNFGGVGTSTCGAPAQTITVTCE